MEFHKLDPDEYASLSSHQCQHVSAGIEKRYIQLFEHGGSKVAHDSVSSYKKIGIICPYEKFGKSRYRTSAYPSTLMRNQCEMSINFLTCEGACTYV